MKSLTLKRIANSEYGTQGVLIDNLIPFAVTLEPEWLGNAKDISCIPAGQYTCRRLVSARYGETFRVVDVSHRTGILFHRGNVEGDTAGCILVAEEYGVLGDDVAVLSSGRGFGEFMRKLDGIDEFILTIVWV